MARILLYTIHDYACSGIRTLGAYCRAHGHDAKLCFLGGENGILTANQLRPNALKALDSKYDDLTFIVHSNPGHLKLPEPQYDFAISEVFLDFLKECSPDVIGFSCRSILTPYSQDWFKSIKNVAPKAMLIA